jgi:uncharacterized Ntn-hydrolase superfamily protein
MRLPRLSFAAFGFAVSFTQAAGATWSIAAVDSETREVGVAVASCIGNVAPRVIALAPDRGAAAVQAQLSSPNRSFVEQRLAAGDSAREVLDAVLAQDSYAESRQYGIVDLLGATATHTGTQTSCWAGDRAGAGFTVQGNILVEDCQTDGGVIDASFEAFEAAPPAQFENRWTLADRLLVALEAGAAKGGDNRCSFEQTALSAGISVGRSSDSAQSPYLELTTEAQRGGANPVSLLRVAYDNWRLNNPRPERPDAGVPDAGSPDAGSGGARIDAAAGDSAAGSGGQSSGTGNTGGNNAGDPGLGGSSRTDAEGAGGGSKNNGCAVSIRRRTPWDGALLAACVLIVAAIRRRSRCEGDEVYVG